MRSTESDEREQGKGNVAASDLGRSTEQLGASTSIVQSVNNWLEQFGEIERVGR
jgi:hypothetical protein